VSESVISDIQQSTGIIRLNRPQALNALNLSMIQSLHAALDRFASSPSIARVIIESASEKAFCAGGDMRRARELVLEGKQEEAVAFFEAEFDVNALIAAFPKPFIALIDGICMGGGLGLSVHGPYRVTTERALFAMPETAIGYFPDIGGTYFLPRLGTGLGHYLALTGTRLRGADAVRLGIGSHFVAASRLPPLRAALIGADDDDIPAILAPFISPVPATGNEDKIARLAALFDAPSVRAIVANLEADASPIATEALAELRAGAPSSIDITFRLLQAGLDRTLGQCLSAELATVRAILPSPDFIEGVRSVLVDKDRKPRWTTSLEGGVAAS